ncbi:MAG: hypothetical protein IPQ09_21630 [Myxococcales bacterium]|nr:hypothetical protein [Myxococcales bacterium]HQY60542.1 hypothetical protein [Polyangiaceae bacterium]
MRTLARLARAVAAASIAGAALVLSGCGGHEARTLRMRTALDEGDSKAALAAVNEELEVKSSKDLPAEVVGDNALLVLDRASIQQSVLAFDDSKRDFQAADKAIDMLDLSKSSLDAIGTWVFSDSAGKYIAPPHEKLLINALNMLNYLETGDLSGAKVEARRLAVMTRYLRDVLKESDNGMLALGGVLAGFAFEKSGDTDEALRYYDEALAFGAYPALAPAVHDLLPRGNYSSPRLTALAQSGGGRGDTPSDPDAGDVLIVVGHGRVPHKIAERVPIGLALTLAAGHVHGPDVAAANKLAAQGLVTWINFPRLAPGQGAYATPSAQLDGRYLELSQVADVSREVRRAWERIEGRIIASAITRMIARYAAGSAVGAVGSAAGGKNGDLIGTLLSLFTQAALTAADTPDTRSWETLPARVVFGRARLPAGRHTVTLGARGWSRRQEFVVEKGAFKVVSLMALN